MAGPGEKVRFALDQNYPSPVIQAFGTLMPYAELSAVADIDPALAVLDDWELFLALHRLHPRWDGLITNDDSLLAQPKEMTVLSQTHSRSWSRRGRDTARFVPSGCSSRISVTSATTARETARRCGS
jgi:hypothetical protein